MNRKERREEEERQLVKRRKAANRSITMMFLLCALAFVIVNFFGPSEGAKGSPSSLTPSSASEEGNESLGPEALDRQEAESSRKEQKEIPWNLILVNAKHALPQDFSVSLVEAQGSERVDARILPDTTALLDAAKNDGVTLILCSGYRSVSKQASLFEQDMNRYLSQGFSREESEKKIMRTLQKPGYSEHHTGLAIDLVTPEHQTLDAAFDKTSAFAWLHENAASYGFILRYPQDKEDITGIEYEPWHYRYVGKEHAQAIFKAALSFEEYYSSLGLWESSSY